jgi:hypothetical protein
LAEKVASLSAEVPPFDIIITPSVQKVFSDGMAQLQLGYPISTLFFHDVVMPPPKPGAKEERHINLILQIPTVTLIESAKIILAGAKEVMPQMIEATAEQQRKLSASIADVIIADHKKP